ncbi:MAG: HEAT repeat domain-containing protein [Dehalococcoidales bacterium]
MDRSIEADAALPLENSIASLADSGKPLLSSRLADLTDLKQGELRSLDEVWRRIEPKRRRQIVCRLVELAEDNVELNFDSIFKHCLKDEDKQVRGRAIEGLWENEEGSLVEPLISLMEQDGSPKVQAAAATALGRFAMLAEHQKLSADYVFRLGQALLAAVGDRSKHIEVRCRALEAVAPLSLPQVRQAIMATYHSGSSKLKVSAIYAMGKSCDLSWLPVLLKELASARAELRYEVAGACGELGEDEAVPYLIELTHDTDADVQLVAIRALGKIGGGEAKERLQQCLSHQSEVVQQAAAQALDELEVMAGPLFPHGLDRET